MSEFNTTWWDDKEFKKWVVVMSHGPQRRRESQTLYVRARTREGAVKTARRETRLPRNSQAYARLATPHDLGCVST